jgi:hypothetical protein
MWNDNGFFINFKLQETVIIWFITTTNESWLDTNCVRYILVWENLTLLNLHVTFKVMEFCRWLKAATLTALQVNTSPLWLFPTLYVKSDSIV